jgi:hypothetical protein
MGVLGAHVRKRGQALHAHRIVEGSDKAIFNGDICGIEEIDAIAVVFPKPQNVYAVDRDALGCKKAYSVGRGIRDGDPAY